MGSKLFYNGCIHSMEHVGDTYKAMLVTDGRIEKLYKENEMPESLVHIQAVDLGGNMVLPSFIDSHVHLTQTGLNQIGIPLDCVKNKAEMLRSIQTNMSRMENEVIVFGTGYDETNMEAEMLPSIQEIDAVVPDKYLWLSRVDSHSCLVNTAFLEAIGLDLATPGVDKDASGKPTGVLRNSANSIARRAALNWISDGAREEGISKAIDQAVINGVTTIHALEGGPLFADKDFVFISGYKARSPIRIEPYFQKMEVAAADTYALDRLGGCIILDGSFGSRTAALLEPYTDDPSTQGSLYVETEALEKFVLEATEKNLQLAFHALGDRAIEQIICAYEKAEAAYPSRALRHRIEHFELPNESHIARAKSLGVILSMQPAFDYYWGGQESMYYDRLGEERTKRAIPLRRILESGAMMIGGSDSDVTAINPIIGIHGSVNHSNAEESIPVFEAVRMFTYNGAYALKRETELGTLAAGKFADFVILDQDIFSISPEKIDTINVMATYCNGNCVFEK